MAGIKKRKLLLLGWDSADWKIINPLIDAGEMPALERLINNGVMGNLATLNPPYSPMLWSTIATGKYPDEHGILGFTEPIPEYTGIRPVASTSRKSKAVWNILMQNDYKVHTVGWWPSHPAEPLNGICISDLYCDIRGGSADNWELPEKSVHPENYRDLFKYLRVHSSELTEAHILPFVPNAAVINQEKDDKLARIAKEIAECTTNHNAATWIMENQEWDFLALYLVNIDHACHMFMNYYPPKLDHVNEREFGIYNEVVKGMYRYHDMMLERIVDLAGPETTIMLISDHGFHSDQRRPLLLPQEPAAPALQHRDFGIFCVSGPDIKKDDTIYGASLLNIAPTILSLFDLPVGSDMPGRVLSDIFEKEMTISTIPSWESIEGNCGMHDREIQMDPKEAQETLQQLIDLGYIEEPGDDMKGAVENTIRELDFNLVKVYMGSGREKEAIPVLEKLFDFSCEDSRFAMNLASCYIALGLIEQAKQTISKFRKTTDSRVFFKKQRAELLDKISKTRPQDKEILTLLKELRQLNNLGINLAKIDMVEADLLMREGNYKESLKVYKTLEGSLSNHAPLYIQMGNALLKSDLPEEAQVEYKKALHINNENNSAHLGLGIAYLRMNQNEEAIESILTSIGLVYNNPLAHFNLAEALFNLKEYKMAAEACEVALKISPDFGKARNFVIKLYHNFLKDEIKAAEHKNFFISINSTASASNTGQLPQLKNKISTHQDSDNTIFVVSGLPRSGTSMMMQILEKGGLEVYTDEAREADKNNPEGYYEHEAVKRLARDKKWVKDAQGKVVKVISHLLPHLPLKFNYKIVFMVRDLDEVVASQQKMLINLNKTEKVDYPFHLKKNFEKNLKIVDDWLREKYNIQVLYINYHDVLNPTRERMKEIADFIGKNLDIELMKTAVRSELYRTRKQS